MTRYLKLQNYAADISLDLNASGYTLLDGYVPEVGADDQPLTDRFDLMLQSTSWSNVQLLVRAIELAFEHARQNKTGFDGMWLYFSPGTPTVTQYRSRVYNGTIAIDASMNRRYKSNQVKLAVTVERDPFWEASNEVSVPMTNGNGTSQTSLNIYNCNDGAGSSPNKRHNYIDILAADVIGDMPAPVKLMMRYPVATYQEYNRYILCQSIFGDPANQAHWIEGESEATALGTDTTDASCSGGKYRDFALDANASLLPGWDISGSLGKYTGKYCLLLASLRASSNSVTFKITPIIRIGGGSFWPEIAWKSPADASKFYGALLGVGKLPPYPVTGYIFQGGSLELEIVNTDLVNQRNLFIDSLQIAPLDGFWDVTFPTNAGGDIHTIVLNGMTEEYFIFDNSSPAEVFAVGATVHGDGIRLYPGRNQRIELRQMSWYDGRDNPAAYINATMYYRPRWRAL